MQVGRPYYHSAEAKVQKYEIYLAAELSEILPNLPITNYTKQKIHKLFRYIYWIEKHPRNILKPLNNITDIIHEILSQWIMLFVIETLLKTMQYCITLNIILPPARNMARFYVVGLSSRSVYFLIIYLSTYIISSHPMTGNQ